MFAAIMLAHEEIKKLIVFINQIVSEIGKPKFSYPSGELDHDMFDKIFAFCEKDVMNALDTDDKNVRDARTVPVQDAMHGPVRRGVPGSRGSLPRAHL